MCGIDGIDGIFQRISRGKRHIFFLLPQKNILSGARDSSKYPVYPVYPADCPIDRRKKLVCPAGVPSKNPVYPVYPAKRTLAGAAAGSCISGQKLMVMMWMLAGAGAD